MRPVIRRAFIDDAAVIAELASASFALACPPGTRQADLEAYIGSELTPARFRTHLADPARSTFLAELGDRLAGYVMVGTDAPPAAVVAARPMELCKLYVRAEHHGQGIADLLMDAAKQAALRAHHDALWLGVFQRNARALAFYRRHGFEVVGEQRFLVGSDPQEDYIMRCMLPASGDAP